MRRRSRREAFALGGSTIEHGVTFPAVEIL
jgi:hypothetical protein